MRCKNCGSENDDNLYICQNCGSPLYDEDNDNDIDIINEDDMGKTRVAPVVQSNQRQPAPQQRSTQGAPAKSEQDKKKEKTVIIIVVLAVVLAIAVTTLVAVLVSNSKKNKDVEDTSIPIASTSEALSTTVAPPTTEPTTESTTQPTTESTTAAPIEYTVTVSCSQGGEVEGDGSYAEGEKCTVIARADDDFEFDGWYKNGKRVSSNEVYTFAVKDNTELEAVFTDITDVSEDYE